MFNFSTPASVLPVARRASFLKKIKHGGFTIAELIIVIAIFTIITTVALLDQNRLNSGVLITNLAYETALSIREAQVYGVGVRNFGGAEVFSGQFGTYFNITSPTQIILFNDKNENNVYDADLGEAQYQYEFTEQRGNKIKALCLGSLGGSACNADSTASVTSLRILFKRPNLEAKFYAIKKSDGSDTTSIGPAYIVVDNIDGNNCRVVVVEPTGQIRIERSADSSAC